MTGNFSARQLILKAGMGGRILPFQQSDRSQYTRCRADRRNFFPFFSEFGQLFANQCTLAQMGRSGKSAGKEKKIRRIIIDLFRKRISCDMNPVGAGNFLFPGDGSQNDLDACTAKMTLLIKNIPFDLVLDAFIVAHPPVKNKPPILPEKDAFFQFLFSRG